MKYLAFWMLPLVSAAVWLSTLMAMLIKWVGDGE
jgi:hypothetical protein